MNGYRMAVLGAALSTGLAGCHDSPASAKEKPREGGVDTKLMAVTMSSGTGSTQGFRGGADFIPPNDSTANPNQPRGGGAAGVGLRPGRSASGISP